MGGVARVDPLLAQWTADGCDKPELARRLIDLFFVSVLLDAGAGDVWKFQEPATGESYGRSEGIAVASLYMFQAGVFQGAEGPKAGVDGTCAFALFPSSPAPRPPTPNPTVSNHHPCAAIADSGTLQELASRGSARRPSTSTFRSLRTTPWSASAPGLSC